MINEKNSRGDGMTDEQEKKVISARRVVSAANEVLDKAIAVALPLGREILVKKEKGTYPVWIKAHSLAGTNSRVFVENAITSKEYWLYVFPHIISGF